VVDWRLDAERSQLAERHVGLAEKIARASCRWGSEDLDDTRSDALWGLILAARAFEPGRGSFTTYAWLRIEYAIRRGRQIRSGHSRSAWEGGDCPTLVSLNSPVRDGGPDLLDVLPGPHKTEADTFSDLLRRLTPRERFVLKLRYYHDLTQADIARIIGRSQIRISQIERAALSTLRKSFANHPLAEAPPTA
jgi:RNA polymerase sigma factor (sigma-70 family)